MPITTWTYTFGFDGWTFVGDETGNDNSYRTHVPGAIRIQIVIVSGGTVFADNTSPSVTALISSGDTVELDISATSDALNMSTTLRAYYTDETFDGVVSANNADARTITLNLTAGKTLSYLWIRFQNTFGGSLDHTRDIDEVRLITSVPVSQGEMPLAFDLDLESGSRLWTTRWQDDGLYLLRHDSDLNLENEFPFSTGTTHTIFDIENRTYYLAPYCPPFWGDAALNDTVYVFGRYNDSGTERHLLKSTDGGENFSDIGDSSSWDPGWIGAFFAIDANTMYAFLNGDNRALYRTTNGGTTWTNLSSLPFDVDGGGVSLGGDGKLLIINRDPATQMAAYAEGPDFSSWIDATGSPAFTQGGGGANSVAWIT